MERRTSILHFVRRTLQVLIANLLLHVSFWNFTTEQDILNPERNTQNYF